MASPAAGRPSRTATHYQVLDLQPALLAAAEAQDASALVKRAYRRALLRNHPDKATAATLFTVDQIGEAYGVLSSTRRRQEYDAALRSSGGAGDEEATRFQTGIENVDLDDLEFDDGEERWHRSCRCGNDRGYAFEEADLVEASEDGVLMVGCQDCSLWLKVHFAVVDE
ncbi:DnaJ domain protein [Cordyceps fumosorosea ARSEF 2679]|uniref:Diphthamide biosynthesis protein 4 n=1 Tax=Cordyceps fumosorosea (strain ARSEF 2679) TaxID=1081104 RepID=A0A168DXQ9_CORFA|nr:DnaJ domain protein [Cordyceps fumosorosea ARSEF 2679]OAA73135.1 DnaJ domain protein [Cordyceps fumosorosea ARSEF 2679]